MQRTTTAIAATNTIGNIIPRSLPTEFFLPVILPEKKI
jgi:hypothetical protein